MIKKKRFQNRIAESRWASFKMSIIALMVWLVAGLKNLQPDIIGSFMCISLTAIIMGQLNSANALIRIYSRMIMCSFIAITSMATFLFTNIASALVTLCSALFYIFLFRCYQDKSSHGWIFYAYLIVGLASIFWIQILFFIPFLWFVTSTSLLALDFKNLIASIIGVITPYWFLFPLYAINNRIQEFFAHFTNIVTFGPLADLSSLSIHQIISIAFVAMLALTGTIHFINNSTKDNIRTRLLYETFITIDIVAFAFLLLQPQHYSELYGIIAVNTSPLIGHLIALTHTRWTNWYTIFILIATVTIAAFNLFMA